LTVAPLPGTRNSELGTLFAHVKEPPSLKEPRTIPHVAGSVKSAILVDMSTVQEIEAAIPRLSRAEVEELRAWIEDYLEDKLELADEVKAKLDQSRSEIAEGRYSTCQSD